MTITLEGVYMSTERLTESFGKWPDGHANDNRDPNGNHVHWLWAVLAVGLMMYGFHMVPK